MSNDIYFPNKASTKKNINKVIDKYKLQESSSIQRKERVYKNEDIILLLTKKYIFMRSFLSEDDQIILNIKKILTEGII